MADPPSSGPIAISGAGCENSPSVAKRMHCARAACVKIQSGRTVPIVAQAQGARVRVCVCECVFVDACEGVCVCVCVYVCVGTDHAWCQASSTVQICFSGLLATQGVTVLHCGF